MSSVSLFEKLTKCWQQCMSLHELSPGASEQDIRDAEMKIGRSLTREFHTLFSYSNGISLMGGNIQIYPLDGDEFSIVRASDAHRNWDWPIPDEVVVIGGNGQDEIYGLWAPKDEEAPPVIVEIGAIFEPGTMSIVGSSLFPFLLGQSAYYVQVWCEDRKPLTQALDILEVPPNLRTDNPDDDLMTAVIDWADPNRPDTPFDAYKARLDADGVRGILRNET